MKKQIKRILAVVVTVCILAGTVSSQVLAATYSKNGIEISINEGAVKLVADGAEYQLAGKLVVRDAWIDQNGTVYLWYRNNRIKFCNYGYQGAEVTNLQLLENAQEIVKDDDEVVGYKTETGDTKALLTDEEVRKLLKVVETPTQEDNDSQTDEARTTDTNTNASDTSSETTEKRDVDITNDGNGNSTKVDNTDSGKDTGKQNNVSVINKGDNNTTEVTNKVNESDSTGKKNDVSVINNGNGNTTVVNNTTNITNTIKKKAKKVVRNYKVAKNGSVISLLSSKKKEVDKATLKKAVLKYHTRKVKNVKTALFNGRGNMIVFTKKGKLVKIDHNTFKVKTISKGITKIEPTSRGLAKWAYRKDGTRFSVAKK